MTEDNYSPPTRESPLKFMEGVDLEAVMKRIAETDWEKIRKEEQENCEHERAWKFTVVNLRGFASINHSYLCKGCNLKTKFPIGEYKNQPYDPRELENILYAQTD